MLEKYAYMFWRKKSLKVDKRAFSLRAKDPLCEFRKSKEGEIGKYDLPGELWKALLKLAYIALALALAWFLYECWLAWDIFQ